MDTALDQVREFMYGQTQKKDVRLFMDIAKIESVDKVDDINPFFNIPQYTYPCCMVVFGYPDKEHLPAQKRKRFDNKYIIFENEYKRFNSEKLKDMMLERTRPREYKDCVSDYIGKKHNSDSTKARMVSINKYIERYTKD